MAAAASLALVALAYGAFVLTPPSAGAASVAVGNVAGFVQELPERLTIAASLTAAFVAGYLLWSGRGGGDGGGGEGRRGGGGPGGLSSKDVDDIESVHLRQGWRPSEEQVRRSRYLRAEAELRAREVAERDAEHARRIAAEEAEERERRAARARAAAEEE